MTRSVRGRFPPTLPPPFPGRHDTTFVGPYPWNAPRPAIGQDISSLSCEEMHQGQAVLLRLNILPRFLATHFQRRFEFLKQNQGLQTAFRYLRMVDERLWSRIEAINARHQMNISISPRFLNNEDNYQCLPDMSDKTLRTFASHIARQMHDAYNDLSDEYLAMHQGDRQQLFTDAAQQWLYGKVAGMARAFNIAPLHWHKYQKKRLTQRNAFAALIRLVTERWWERQLKSQRARWREALLIAIGQVTRATSPYASQQAIQDIHARRISNLDFLKSCELENIHTGERIELIDKVMSSIANPEIRRMELMSTIAGIERYACERGDIGMFITLTTPSKYHATRVVGQEKRVLLNRHWNHSCYTPKDAQHYLVRMWGNIRTALKDRKLPVYGLRVVEPHHDGTPHWHMMLYCTREQRQAIVDILRHYALKEDGNEAGAQQNRVDCKHLNKGGAAGYLAKYIAKNIDGYALDDELDNETNRPLKETAAAVTAWASTWRIPQFHFIGLPTIGAYRECRRIRTMSLEKHFDKQIEAVRQAADIGDFAAYIQAQGGANTPRIRQSVRVARTLSDSLNVYDEKIAKVTGIFSPRYGTEHIFTTRPNEWRIVSKSTESETSHLTRDVATPWSSVNNCGSNARRPLLRQANVQYQPYNDGNSSTQSASIDWQDENAMRTLAISVLRQTPPRRFLQQPVDPTKDLPRTPSSRLTQTQRQQLVYLKTALRQQGVATSRWEREALARGATIIVEGQRIHNLQNGNSIKK